MTRMVRRLIRSGSRRTSAWSDGYTLVELMVTVAIVGVLAALAVFGLRRYQTWTKSREVTDLIGQLHQAEKKYYLSVDKSGYLSCSANLQAFYPAKPDGKKRLMDNPKHGDYPCWQVLVGARADAPTYHGFAVVAGIAGEAPPTTDLETPPAWPATTTHWYVIQAAADHDGDGKLTYYVSSSFSPGQVLQSLEAE